MSENTEKYDRREALTTIGKTLAAAAIGLPLLSSEASAQTLLSFIAESYRAYNYSAPQYSWECKIFLYSAGNAQSCVLVFLKEGETIPANTISPSGTSGSIYFPHGRLAEIRDFLRYEKPVRITVASNGIATLANEDYELVGDGDV